MSILLKSEILSGYNDGSIIIEPFNEENLGPNSYDVRLDDKLIVYDMERCGVLDYKQQNPVMILHIPPEGLVLQPNRLYLGTTIERAGSNFYIPMYEGRSSMARLGFQSHISAGFGDVGFKDKWTLEITVIHPLRIYPGIRIGQIFFQNVNQSSNDVLSLYKGKYIDQNGPQPSKSYLDKV